MQKIWRILSIDGGGTRGVIPATILAAIERRTREPISRLFDLIAGTSTGGLLALGLTKPDTFGKPEFSAENLCDIYDEHIPHIFRNPQSWWGNLLAPKYRSHAFQHVLEKFFGDCMLKSALTDVLIPCYDIEHRLPYIFRSRLALEQAGCDLPMKEVALAASASPTLFTPVQTAKVINGRSITLVDGGVFANNPSAIALSEIQSMHQMENEKYLVVSVGTGQSTRPLTAELVNQWGYVHWSRPMLELVMESVSESVHDQMQHLLLSHSIQQYYRLQVRLPEYVDMAIDEASAKHLKALSGFAQDFCSTSEELGSVCDRLLQLLHQRQPT